MSKSKSKKSSYFEPEIIPQSDQFIYGTHPRLKLGLQGHQQTAEIMCDLFNQKKAPHGFLFIGKQGIGKATFVYHLIRALERHHETLTLEAIYDTQKDQIYRRLETLSHGNIQILRRQYNFKTGKFYQNIRMEDLLSLKSFFNLKAHSHGRRYVIIDSLDDSVHGQNSVPNALLKTLEEPPENCYFFILVHKEGQILPTIKSRCMQIKMQPPTMSDLKILLKDPSLNAKPPSDEMMKLADGSVRMALILADPIWSDLFKKIKMILFKGGNSEQILPLQPLKNKAYDGCVSFYEYLYILNILMSKALNENAKYALSQGSHATAYASAVIFEHIQDLFTKAEEYNFTIPEVLERLISYMNYYQYLIEHHTIQHKEPVYGR